MYPKELFNSFLEGNIEHCTDNLRYVNISIGVYCLVFAQSKTFGKTTGSVKNKEICRSLVTKA